MVSCINDQKELTDKILTAKDQQRIIELSPIIENAPYMLKTFDYHNGVVGGCNCNCSSGGCGNSSHCSSKGYDISERKTAAKPT